MTEFDEFFAKLDVIIDLSIKSQTNRSIRAPHRLNPALKVELEQHGALDVVTAARLFCQKAQLASDQLIVALGEDLSPGQLIGLK